MSIHILNVDIESFKYKFDKLKKRICYMGGE